jgi:Uma2 family endonuclease
MSESARRLATWEDLLATPEDGRVWEVLNGQLEAQPPRWPVHGYALAGLAGELARVFDRNHSSRDGWWIVPCSDIRFGPHDIVAPDCIGWRRARLLQLPATRPVDVVPDWVCEVISPNGMGRDRVRKANLYLRSGVLHYWILDPEDRVLEAYEARSGAWLRLGAWGDGDLARIPPFDAIEIDVGSLLVPLPETPPESKDTP